MKGMLRLVIYEDAIASFGMLADDAEAHGWERDHALYLEAQRRARARRAHMVPHGLNVAAAKRAA